MSTLPLIGANKVTPITFNTNYFNLFGLPISDTHNPLLESKYHQLLKMYNQQSKTENEKIFLNMAYGTLKDDLKRILYMKEINNQHIKSLSVEKLEDIFDFFNQNCENPKFEEILEKKSILCKEKYFQTTSDDDLSEWMYWERLLNRHIEKNN